jgi:hypothetical protein
MDEEPKDNGILTASIYIILSLIGVILLLVGAYVVTDPFTQGILANIGSGFIASLVVFTIFNLLKNRSTTIASKEHPDDKETGQDDFPPELEGIFTDRSVRTGILGSRRPYNFADKFMKDKRRD